MPSRVIREGFLDSEKINAINPQAQIFFVRLMLIADDFGRLDGRIAVIKSKAFPLDNATQKQVGDWLTIVSQKGLVKIYKVGDKRFVSINEFNQRLRKMKSRYPSPAGQPPDNGPPIDGLKQKGKEKKGKERGDFVLSFDDLPEPIKSKKFFTAFNEFIEHRIENKSRMTERSIKMSLKQLAEYGQRGAIESIRKSIANGWKGLFPVSALPKNPPPKFTPEKNEGPIATGAQLKEAGKKAGIVR